MISLQILHWLSNRQLVEVHRRHHISATGFYRGKKVVATKAGDEE